jgi:hypothetical protein
LTDIKLLHLTPQNDATLVIAVHFADTNACNEDKFQMHKSHQKKAKSTIKGAGRVNNIKDVIKVCTNFCAIQRAIFNTNDGYLFLHNFAVKIILCICSHHFQLLYLKNKPKLVHLHYVFMQEIHHLFVQIATFSSISKNTNSTKNGGTGKDFDMKNFAFTFQFASSFLNKVNEYIHKDTVPVDVLSFAQGILVATNINQMPKETSPPATAPAKGNNTKGKPSKEEAEEEE